MGGHRVGDCGLVPEDCVVAFIASKTRKRGRLRGGAAPFFLVSSTGCFEAYATTHLSRYVTTVGGALLFLLDDVVEYVFSVSLPVSVHSSSSGGVRGNLSTGN